MIIQVNGQQYEIEKSKTISELIEEYAFSGQRIAVELNRKILSRGNFSSTYVKSGDKLEIVTAIGGG